MQFTVISVVGWLVGRESAGINCSFLSPGFMNWNERNNNNNNTAIWWNGGDGQSRGTVEESNYPPTFAFPFKIVIMSNFVIYQQIYFNPLG